MDNTLFKSVEQSVRSLFKNGKPLHHLPSAKSRQYHQDASKFFIVSKEELEMMSAYEVQNIFRHRHILVPGKQSGKKFDRASLRSIGSLTQKRQVQG
jgi:hypothetical protein